MENEKVAGTGYSAVIHISALVFSFVSVAVPFLNIIAPFVLWLIKKDDSPFIDFHGREAVRFQVVLTICALVIFLVIFLTAGLALIFTIPFVLLLLAVEIIFPLIAAVKAADGKRYCYPFSPRKKEIAQ